MTAAARRTNKRGDATRESMLEAARKALAAGSLQVGASAVQIEKRRGVGERGGAPRGRGGHRGGRGAHAAA